MLNNENKELRLKEWLCHISPLLAISSQVGGGDVNALLNIQIFLINYDMNQEAVEFFKCFQVSEQVINTNKIKSCFVEMKICL